MARTKKAAKPTQAAAEAIDLTPLQDTAPRVTAPAPPIAADETRQPAKEAAGHPAYAADPHPKISVSLSKVSGGPAMHLLRSHRFRQMQIQFDRQQPDEQYLAMLKQAGWTDRTESEGVWTKQIDPEARWQSVRQMEQEFKQVANAIRRAKGMRPVLEGLAMT